MSDSQTHTTLSAPNSRLLRQRARRALWFGFKMIAGFVWWELILVRLIGRERVERTRMMRFVKLARSFRALAVDLGGVWIKLGQFLSSRVDIIPQPIIAELSGLQDAVPPEPYDTIAQIIEVELGRPVDAVFDDFEREPVAAASFGQAHRARLHTVPSSTNPSERVIVKVQRPFLDEIVKVDLRSLKTIARWLKLYEPVRRRANLDALIREFADGVLEELDYEQEARNAELFARNFAADPQVRAPKPYHAFTTRRVLTLENVEDIKITDFEGLESAGVSRKAVARKLFNTYLQQIFIDGFFHADPHPGNLFVQPLDLETARRLNVPIDDAPPSADGRPPTPFCLTYVDFGMVGRVSPEVMQELKEVIIAVSLKDARRLTAAAKRMGFFLPGADTTRIEQAIALLFDRFWGMTATDLKDVEFDEMYSFALEFRDLLSSLPFQIPQNILYLGRAVNILSGMSTALDPTFNAWKEIQPFVESVINKQEQRLSFEAAQETLNEALRLLRLTVQLPVQADAFLSRALGGQLEIRAQLSESSTNDLRQIQNGLSRLTWALVFTALLICATLLLINDLDVVGAACLAAALLTLLRMVFK
ncbi:MAG: AarF/UbiB family protein [Anaerolineae bacterium]|nr:AarF/UbiB family protein [Thermoflexales bacterium]MDW8407768.1 AarF/UbiB family protein [Anaerolineae bacterium]